MSTPMKGSCRVWVSSILIGWRVNQTVGGHFRRHDRRHRRRDGAVPDGIWRLESAKFPTRRAQQGRPVRSLYQLCCRRCPPDWSCYATDHRGPPGVDQNEVVTDSELKTSIRVSGAKIPFKIIDLRVTH